MINKFVTFASSVLTISNIYFLASFYRYYSGVAGISPPKGCRPPFRDLAPPPPLSLGNSPPPPSLRFRNSYFLYFIGVKNNGEKIGHFETKNNSVCENDISTKKRTLFAPSDGLLNTLISCRRCVRGLAKRYFHFL